MSASDVPSVWLVPVIVAAIGALVLAQGRRSGPVVVRYEPPAMLRPVEAGVLLDGRLDVDDFVAGIVDLAVRGYLTLERVAHAIAGDDVLVSVSRPWQSDAGVHSFEITILARVYERGTAARLLSEVRTDRDDLDALAHVVAADLADAGLFVVPPASAERAGRWLAVIVTAVWAQLAWNAGAPLPSYAAALVTGAILWIFASLLPRRLLSRSGRDARRGLLGFREFLRRAERDRLAQLPPAALPELLPWAIALGVIDPLVERCAGQPVPAPAWYAPASSSASALGDEMHRVRSVARRGRSARTG
jgi:hypothetical protein